jgi:hypothetical protein
VFPVFKILPQFMNGENERKIVESVLAILHFKSCNTSIKEVALVNFLKNRGIKLYGNM